MLRNYVFLFPSFCIEWRDQLSGAEKICDFYMYVTYPSQLFFKPQIIRGDLPKHQHTLKMGTEFVPETSENLHILTQLCVRENFFNLKN
jgi:hypothetical protein